MKIVEFRRHSIKKHNGDTSLSAKGYALARLVGERCLRGKKFTAFYTSSVWRTAQTLAAFAEGADDFHLSRVPEIFPLHRDISDKPSAMRLWMGACKTAEQRGEDMFQALLRKEPAAAKRMQQQAARALRSWLAKQPDRCHALVVGHSPFFELIALGLFGLTLPQLQPCDGFRVIEDKKGLRLETADQDPSLNVSALRS